ncbi:unnamed protein product [Symbiodinium pilosum]|uniref:Pentatricopeptide repeat-containing protein, chloroplastic n=1 Tax=Symbiodinium pilosum TaxID=2952 RepID=A0A812M285_SYMPI|nr:unnamed protein product [Symbiodinium pilosum]
MASMASYAEALVSLQQARRWEDALVLLEEMPGAMYRVNWLWLSTAGRVKSEFKKLHGSVVVRRAIVLNPDLKAWRLLSDCRAITGIDVDAVAVLLTLAAVEQAGNFKLLFGALARELLRVSTHGIAEGSPFGAPATAANYLRGVNFDVTISTTGILPTGYGQPLSTNCSGCMLCWWLLFQHRGSALSTKGALAGGLCAGCTGPSKHLPTRQAKLCGSAE